MDHPTLDSIIKQRNTHILAHRRTRWYFDNLGDDADAFTLRRSQYIWQHKAAIGFANAVAVARRADRASLPPVPRQCAHPPPSTLPTSSPIIVIFRIHFAWCTSGLCFLS